jgi:hypothetical protein
LQFEVTAGLDVLVGLLDQAWPVGDAAAHITDVDVVKLIFEGPLGLYVIDFEFEIWWDP